MSVSRVLLGLVALASAGAASLSLEREPPAPMIPPAPVIPTAVVVATPSYADLLSGLASERAALAARWRAAKGPKTRARVLSDAREAARKGVVEDVFPRWFGTRWDFNGVSQTPGEGTIACGYFVSTVLRDAGFKVERIRLAQQASENIVRSLTPPAGIRTFRGKTPEEVTEEIRAGEDGLFAVGFDYHVGFVVKEGDTVTFCHSSFINSGGVACEDPASTGAWYSTYYVVGRMFDDPMLIAWLEGTAIPTRR